MKREMRAVGVFDTYRTGAAERRRLRADLGFSRSHQLASPAEHVGGAAAAATPLANHKRRTDAVAAALPAVPSALPLAGSGEPKMEASL